MKCLLVSVLLMSACTEKFHALSPNGPKTFKGTPTVTVTVLSPDLVPECDASTKNLRIWVAAEGQAKRCRGNSWTVAQLGKESFGYEKRAQTRYNQWEDLETRKRWSVAEAKGSDIKQMCKQGWRLPEKHEIATASAHGLFLGIKANGGLAFQRAWAKASDSEGSIAVDVIPASNPNEPNLAHEKDLKMGVYCVLDS